MDEPMGSTTKLTFGRLLQLYEAEAESERPLNPDNFSPNLILNRTARLATQFKWSNDIAFGAYLIARWINAADLVVCSESTLARYVHKAALWLAIHCHRRVLWLRRALRTVAEYEQQLWKIIHSLQIYHLLPY